MVDHITRRQFLKVSGAALGGAAAVELIGLGLDTRAVQAQAQTVPLKRGKEVPSICPYCAVGCAQIVTVDTTSNKIIDIQGNPDSPINRGTLCPKGAATYQLTINPLRETKVKHRAPGSDHWEDMSLDDAMNRIAQLVKQTRDQTFVVEKNGKKVYHTKAIASLGGATLDNEENYLMKKYLSGLGVVYIENQARI
ncbi:MAG: twin-arginine translocation signal domain-containing protein [Chloroflexi bacterium]|nr:twin-arginine translocation signal domain-containing protein [Chloroflexota bacterium]